MPEHLGRLLAEMSVVPPSTRSNCIPTSSRGPCSS